jgi:hypothetical protein
MKRRLYALFLGLGFLAATFVTAPSVQATLGESADSVDSDRKALSAVRCVTTIRNGYTVQVIKSDSAVVREYVSSSGVVFGIAWNGMVHPDLRQLLGSYAGEYQEAIQKTLANQAEGAFR